jgi:Rrf2 family protein
MGNSRFTVAIHTLTLLAYCGEEALTSDFIAASVSTNPVVIRRLLASLRASRLVSSQGGPGGGWRLARPPAAIALRDVYRAVEEADLFPLHSGRPNPRCPVGGTIQSVLRGHYQDAQASLERELGRTTIADLLEEVRAAET